MLENISLYSDRELAEISKTLEDLLEEFKQEVEHCKSDIYIY